MLSHFGSLGHAISGYLLATALGGDHLDPVGPALPTAAAPSGEFELLPRRDAASADPAPPDRGPT